MDLDPSDEVRPGKLTPHVRLDELLIEHAHAIARASTRNFVGMYLVGSLAVGDFDATSDVDFMVVTNNELSSDELAAVQAAHSGYLARDDRWPTHLEYSFFPMAKLQTLSSPFGESSTALSTTGCSGTSTDRPRSDPTTTTRSSLAGHSANAACVYSARTRRPLLP